MLLSVHMLPGGGRGGFRKPLEFKNSCSAIFQRRSLPVSRKVVLHSAAAVRKTAIRCAEAARSGQKAEEK